jgi:hypothetical protein
MTRRFDDDTLEAAAQLLERHSGNELYMKAWKTGAKLIRGLKADQKLNDKSEQISSSSSRPV